MSGTKKPSAIAGLRRATTPVPAGATMPAVTTPAEPERRPRPEKPVRFTLDLDRAHHQFLKKYTSDIEARGASQVMRALLDELRDDPQLAARVRDRIWQDS